MKKQKLLQSMSLTLVLLAVLSPTTFIVAAQECTNPNWTVVTTGLNNPRKIRFGPDGYLYVAEAGIGGSLPATCSSPDTMFTPRFGGYTGRISRILHDGTRETVASGLPSSIDISTDALGVSDIAWIGSKMYALIEGGGCTRGLPNDPAGVVSINKDGTYTYVADITTFIRTNPVDSEPECGPFGDCEPDGVPHSMIVDGDDLIVVETNHNSILRVNPRTGVVTRIFDLSVQDPAPITLAHKGDDFYLGGFDGLIQTFERRFRTVSTLDQGYHPIVGLTAVKHQLYILETHAGAHAFDFVPNTGRVVRREQNGSTEVVACGLNFPIGMTRRHRYLYVSHVSYGQGPVEGLGQIVRVALRPDDDDGDEDNN